MIIMVTITAVTRTISTGIMIRVQTLSASLGLDVRN